MKSIKLFSNALGAFIILILMSSFSCSTSTESEKEVSKVDNTAKTEDLKGVIIATLEPGVYSLSGKPMQKLRIWGNYYDGKWSAISTELPEGFFGYDADAAKKISDSLYAFYMKYNTFRVYDNGAPFADAHITDTVFGNSCDYSICGKCKPFKIAGTKDNITKSTLIAIRRSGSSQKTNHNSYQVVKQSDGIQALLKEKMALIIDKARPKEADVPASPVKGDLIEVASMRFDLDNDKIPEYMADATYRIDSSTFLRCYVGYHIKGNQIDTFFSSVQTESDDYGSFFVGAVDICGDGVQELIYGRDSPAGDSYFIYRYDGKRMKLVLDVNVFGC